MNAQILETFRQYGAQLAAAPYDLGPEVQLLLTEGRRSYATRPGAALAALNAADILDATGAAWIEKAALIASGRHRAMILSRPPYVGYFIDEGEALPAVLDDMAQITGPHAAIVPRDRFALTRALRRSRIVLEEDGRLVTCGPTMYDAYTALIIAEKAAEISYKATVFGSARPVNRLSAAIDHRVYEHKYARQRLQNNGKKPPQAGAESGEPETAPPAGAALRRAGEQLVRYGCRLLDTGLVQATWGNLSIRIDDERMLCTPSGRDYRTLRPEDMVLVDLQTLDYDGDIKPTSEKAFHAAIYQARPDVHAIIHTHSRYCCIFAACDLALHITDAKLAAQLGADIDCARYALAGTRWLSRNAQQALSQNNACFLSHHGMLACGTDIEAAFQNCAALERIAESEIEQRWTQLLDEEDDAACSDR